MPRPPPPPPPPLGAPPTSAIAMASSGDGPRYLDPDHVYNLYITLRPKELVDYLDSFPGAGDDLRCLAIKHMAKTFLPYATTLPGQEHQIRADCARGLAQECRFLAAGGTNDFVYCGAQNCCNWNEFLSCSSNCLIYFNFLSSFFFMLGLAAPGNVVYVNNITANPGHFMDSPYSSSYNVVRHTESLAASSIRIPPESSTQLQENLSDGHYMNPFYSSSYAERVPSRKYARIIPRIFAGIMSGSSYARTMPGSLYAGRMPGSSYARTMPVSSYAGRMPGSSYARTMPGSSYAGRMPVSNYHPKYVAMLNQTSVSNTRFPAPMFLQTNSNNDIKGMRHAPAPGIIQKKERFVKLSIASLIAPDGTQGFGGVLMRGSKERFICALCFPIPGTEPASVFEAACCEAIRAVKFFNPNTCVLESHLFPLSNIQHVQKEKDEMKARGMQLCCTRVISEESNGAACQLAIHALQIGRYHIFLQTPAWLVLR